MRNAWLFSVGATVLAAGFAYGQATSTGSGQAFPNRPIRMVTSSVGSGNDAVARLIAPGIAGPLGQQVIVENRPSGTIPIDLVAKAEADGYTVLLYGGTIWIMPLLQRTPYDPINDFAPITLVEKAPLVLVVNPTVAANSVRELIALAKAKPGALNYASAATGSSTHLAAELFKSMAGVDMVRVNYKGGAAAATDLIAGQVQLMFFSPPPVMPHVKTGRLRALAVTSREPSALAPGLPTVEASGLPGFESVTVTGIFAPAKTPVTVIRRLNQEIVRLVTTPEAKEKFFSSGSEVVGSTPEQLATAGRSETAKWGKLIKDTGIRAE